MARVLTAYLKRTDVPTRTALQHVLDPIAPALTRDDGSVPLKTFSDLPCALDGEDSGFDLCITDASGPRQDV
jgi:hypothetical protein